MHGYNLPRRDMLPPGFDPKKPDQTAAFKAKKVALFTARNFGDSAHVNKIIDLLVTNGKIQELRQLQKYVKDVQDKACRGGGKVDIPPQLSAAITLLNPDYPDCVLFFDAIDILTTHTQVNSDGTKRRWFNTTNWTESAKELYDYLGTQISLFDKRQSTTTALPARHKASVPEASAPVRVVEDNFDAEFSNPEGKKFLFFATPKAGINGKATGEAQINVETWLAGVPENLQIEAKIFLIMIKQSLIKHSYEQLNRYFLRISRGTDIIRYLKRINLRIDGGQTLNVISYILCAMSDKDRAFEVFRCIKDNNDLAVLILKDLAKMDRDVLPGIVLDNLAGYIVKTLYDRERFYYNSILNKFINTFAGEKVSNATSCKASCVLLSVIYNYGDKEISRNLTEAIIAYFPDTAANYIFEALSPIPRVNDDSVKSHIMQFIQSNHGEVYSAICRLQTESENPAVTAVSELPEE
jgi:hypothetical protein